MKQNLIFRLFLVTVLSSGANSFSWDQAKVESLFYNVQEMLEEVDWNPDAAQCMKDFKSYIKALRTGTRWALQVKDAWAKEPSGLFSGVSHSFGDYDQCLSVTGTYPLQYCDVKVSNTREQSYELGTCVPKSCSQEVLAQLMTNLFRNTELNVTGVTQCLDGQKPPFGIPQYCAIAVCVLLVLVVILSTCNDLSYGNDLFSCFSLYRNTNKLFAYSPEFGSTECLNGIRVVSMLHIIFHHIVVFTYFLGYPAEIISDETKFYKILFFILSGKADLSVDSFFVVGALLLTYNFMRDADKKRERFNVFKYIFHRYVRVIPVLAFIMLLVIAFGPYVSSGPREFVWLNSPFSTVQQCTNFWWSGLLLVQNYVNKHSMCIGPSWYLSVDMQCYILSPLILLPLLKYGRRVVAVVIIVGLTSILYTFTVAYSGNLIFTSYDSPIYFYLYLSTHTRVSPWLIGIGLGYILYATEDTKPRLNRVTVICLWILALLTFAVNLLLPPIYFEDPDVRLIYAVYNAISRPTWALALSWVIYACVNGYGAPIRWFLSLPIFQHVVKLSYSMYLVHCLILMYALSLQRSLAYNNGFNVMLQYFGILTFSWCLAIPLVVFVEMPFISLEAGIYRKLRQNKLKI